MEESRIGTSVAHMGSVLTVSDLELAQRATAGDGRARELLLRRHYATIGRVCRRLCADPVTAEDVQQETLLAVIRHLGSYRGDASFTTWVFTLARTHAGRVARSDHRHRARVDRLAKHLLSLPRSGPDHDDTVAAIELRGRVLAALMSLPPVDRAVLEARDILGYSAAETATALCLSVPAVKTRLHRARGRLRTLLLPELAASAA